MRVAERWAFAASLVLFFTLTAHANDGHDLSRSHEARPETSHITPTVDSAPEFLRLAPAEMRLVRSLAGEGAPLRRLRRVQLALTGDDGAAFPYEVKGSYTAAEALARRRGNCVAFSNLLVAAGRALGIPVRGGVPQVPRGRAFEKGTLVSSAHVVAVVKIEGGYAVLDFERISRARDDEIRVLGDRELEAIYANNRGVESLQEGRLDEALAVLQRAVELDPSFAEARANHGVALRRAGKIGAALRRYDEALALEPGHTATLRNLTVLYRELGHAREAQAALRTLELRSVEWSKVVRADLLLAAGDARAARRIYRRILKASPGFRNARVGLAEAELLLGRVEAAREHLAALPGGTDADLLGVLESWRTDCPLGACDALREVLRAKWEGMAEPTVAGDVLQRMAGRLRARAR